jgi:hypothetical protein
MFGAVASLRKEISPQAKWRKSTPLVRTPFTSPMASISNGKAESTSNAFLLVQLSRTSCELTKNEELIKFHDLPLKFKSCYVCYLTYFPISSVACF